MSQRLLLHIGRHKTGTSAIQNYCCTADEQFARHGAIYPRAGRRRETGTLFPAHHQLAVQCHLPSHDPETFDRIRAEFYEEIAGHDLVVLSSEGFQNIRDFALLDRFFDGFAQFDVSIICYLREYLSYLVSSYRQMTQNQQRFLTFARYCRRDFRIGDFLEEWSAIGDLVTRPFDRGRLKDGDVVADFLDLLGMEREAEGGRIVNHSIGGNLLFFRLIENRYGIEPIPYREAEQLAIDHAPFRRAFYISDEQATQIRASAPYNAIVAKRIGELELQSYAQEPVVPVLDTIDADLHRVYSGSRLANMRNRLSHVLEEKENWFEYRPHVRHKDRTKARRVS
ncbi:MAG: hypothetical protein ABR601_10995 [Parasphingopyxis sp.]|nr:hypothetical protein [Sphingomonadales bacterium]